MFTQMFAKLISTIAYRPYVFVFLIFYLIAIIRLFGIKRASIFTAICWILAFLSEFSSTRTGFPYGFYQYTENTRDIELFLSNIPFMDSLSYTFLQFAGLNLAWLCLFPNFKWNLAWHKMYERPWLTSLVGALLVTYLDIIIDPVAHQGDKWFLGKIYFYENPGAYFGIPITNFLGWFIVSFTSQRLFLSFTRNLAIPNRLYTFPLGDYLGIALYLGVIAFNMVVTYYIGDNHLLFADLYIVFLPLILITLIRHHLNKEFKTDALS